MLRTPVKFLVCNAVFIPLPCLRLPYAVYLANVVSCRSGVETSQTKKSSPATTLPSVIVKDSIAKQANSNSPESVPKHYLQTLLFCFFVRSNSNAKSFVLMTIAAFPVVRLWDETRQSMEELLCVLVALSGSLRAQRVEADQYPTVVFDMFCCRFCAGCRKLRSQN